MDIESRRVSRRKWKLANPEKVKEQTARYRERYKERLKAYRANYYLSYKVTHAEEIKDVGRRTKARLKLLVLTVYGNGEMKCVQCGEERSACLSIDHINNNGASHRRELNRSGTLFYRWLRDNRFPMGYQTLCMNCQWVKKLSSR